MDPIIDVFLTINTCFQDVAAAFMITGLAAVRILLKRYPVPADKTLNESFVRAGLSTALILRSSVYFLLASLVPTVMFRGTSAFGDLKDTALTIRYAGIFILAAAAVFSLSALSRKVSSLRSKHTVRG